MKIGTRSVLFGVHQFLVHPLTVAWAWWRLYGFPWDPRLWVAFLVHDLGYLGKPDMDGELGERHVEWGAWVLGALFGRRWHDFSLYHSRFTAKRDGRPISRLCVADKYAFCVTPRWLYLLLGGLSGEIREYMARSQGDAKYTHMAIDTASVRRWHTSVKDYLERWVAEHKDSLDDTWTKTSQEAKP